MPDIDTPNADPVTPPTPDEIDAWPSGRIPDEIPDTSPNPAGATPTTDPEDAAIPEPHETGDENAQPLS